ncbi:MAG TPA: UvrD-helicase domain-containing protein [Pyrinomonadaceae bacterium]|nr:UvrD-helicase domain-containing protein [Pyrinomonadaceae bacterium]
MRTAESNSQSRQLKPEQAAAAHTLDCHLSVTAGPGSGKTFVLVERYLEILRTKKVSVDNIVAITFTNRAANEMRQRIRERIDALLRATSGNERQTWLRHKRALEGAVITTIHGFCSRLLHEFPVEANIDPQFMLLDEHQAAMLLESVVEEALTDAIHNDEKIVQLAQGAGRAALANALVELHRKYRGEGLSLQAIEKLTAANHASRADYISALKELDQRMLNLISARRLSKGAEEKRIKAKQEWPSLRAILAEPPTEKTVAAYCQAIEDFWDARPRKDSTPFVAPIDEMLWGDDSSTSERLRGRVPTTGFDLLAKDYSLALLKLLREVDRRLDSEKQRLSVLDFDDLQLRALKLLELPEVISRGTERYRFFLVDEFQDTNSLQRDLMTRLALIRGANLFIVGDRKQSIYGFRGADVDVFSEMTTAIEEAGGTQQPLHLNFRSQPPLIDCFNFLFAKIFQARNEVPKAALGQLGYVSHEAGIAERPAEHEPPLVELMVSALPESSSAANESESESEGAAEDRDPLGAQERDAEQIAARIRSLVSGTDFSLWDQASPDLSLGRFKYGDIAILLRAFTGVWTYESALRRAGIPYLTVQGKGFYQREEITDLIQLLRFLDNTTDELALAAVLRSPLGGISDNALLALRCAPWMGEDGSPERLHRRNLLRALRHRREIQFIDEDDQVALDRVAPLLEALIARRNRYGIAELLRHAVSASEFMTIIAANFDGAQRVANVEKLFRLAEQFEKSGHLIRDFVRFVEEFEAIGGREGEGQMDESANVVRLMTIHQAKGLEFPVVIIPDLHREPIRREASFILDRHKGMTVRIPDGRGQTVRGALFNELRQRNRWREEFESMRLLYVAATRARDRLIFSGAVTQKDLKNLTRTDREQWLAWIWQALELDEHAQSGMLELGDNVQVRLTVDRERQGLWSSSPTAPIVTEEGPTIDLSRPFAELFPLLGEVPPEPGQVLRRFSVTQLINFQRCARQYYFDRMLKAPGKEERAVWNDAEAPEPPANLTATLKGAVIHRFCETFREGDDAATRLRTSFEEVVAQRQSELAGRAFEIEPDEAVRDLMPLAQNYLKSEVFQRVSHAGRVNAEVSQTAIRHPETEPGLWSELRFRLRRPLGILTGTIDKLLITPSGNGEGFDVEIIDFKTNRFRTPSHQVAKQTQTAAATATLLLVSKPVATPLTEIRSQPAQALFNFDAVAEEVSANVVTTADIPASDANLSVTEQAETVARDYQLQMQSYALALRELLEVRTGSGSDRVIDSPWNPGLKINTLRATLHFIDPNIEISLPAALLDQEVCVRAIDDAILSISTLDGTLDAALFPPLPATHCRICNFLELCSAGRDWLNR